MDYNYIIIKIVIFKPFLKSKSKKSITIRINNSKMNKFLNFKLSNLKSVISILGFNDYLNFAGYTDDMVVNLKIDNIQSKNYIDFLTNDLPLVIQQYHYITISYGVKNIYTPYFVYDTEGIFNRSVRSSIVKNNPTGNCFYRFDPNKNGKFIFMNNTYNLTSTENGMLYLDKDNNKIVTMYYSVHKNGELVVDYKTDNAYYLGILRSIKIHKFLD